MDNQATDSRPPGQRWALGTHWWLDLGKKGKHEVIIDQHCAGSCHCVVVMAHPKLGAEERMREDWDWSNVLRVHRSELRPER